MKESPDTDKHVLCPVSSALNTPGPQVKEAPLVHVHKMVVRPGWENYGNWYKVEHEYILAQSDAHRNQTGDLLGHGSTLIH